MVAHGTPTALPEKVSLLMSYQRVGPWLLHISSTCFIHLFVHTPINSSSKCFLGTCKLSGTVVDIGETQ